MLTLALEGDSPLPGFFLLKKLDPSYRDNYILVQDAPQRESLRFLSVEEIQDVIAGQYTALAGGDDPPLLPAHSDEGGH